MTKIHPLNNWIPYDLSYNQDEWQIKWLNLEHRRITEPFFDETIHINRLRSRERSPLQSYSSPDFLANMAQEIAHLNPSAFIFHVSRCGSTLLSQAFCEEEENIVIAEAQLLDQILRSSEKNDEITNEQKESWFKAALNLMGQYRSFKESAYIIKLDSWHLHFYTQLRSWFPDTPFFFLSRTPEEILASHEKRRGMHSVPDLVSKKLLRIDSKTDYMGDFTRYTADVLEQYYLQLIYIQQEQHQDNAFADYGDGVKKMIADFSVFTGIEIRNPEKVNARLGYHSKEGREVFKADAPSNLKCSYKKCNDVYERFKTTI